MMKKNSPIRWAFIIFVLSLPLYGSACSVKISPGEKGATSTIKNCDEPFGFIRPAKLNGDDPVNVKVSIIKNENKDKFSIEVDNSKVITELHATVLASAEADVDTPDVFVIKPGDSGVCAGKYVFHYELSADLASNQATTALGQYGFKDILRWTYSDEAQRYVKLTEGCPDKSGTIPVCPPPYLTEITDVKAQDDGSIKVTWSTPENSSIADGYVLLVSATKDHSGKVTLGQVRTVEKTGEATFAKEVLPSAKTLWVSLTGVASNTNKVLFNIYYPFTVPGPDALKPGDPLVSDDEITATVGESQPYYNMGANDKVDDSIGWMTVMGTKYWDESGNPGDADCTVSLGPGPMVKGVYNRKGTYITELQGHYIISYQTKTQRLIAKVTDASSGGENPAKDNTFDNLPAFQEQPLDVLANDGFQSGAEITSTDLVYSNCYGGCSAVNMRIEGSLLKFTGSPGEYAYQYTAKDDQGNTGTANVLVKLVNNAPVAVDDSGIEVAANTTVDIGDTLLNNDSDPNYNSKVAGSDRFHIDRLDTADTSSNATVFLANLDHKVTFSANTAGTYTFYYRLVDNYGANSDWAKVTVTVTSANVAPFINTFTTTKTSVIHDPFAGPYDETFTATCAATDANGDSLTYSLTGDGTITNTGTGTWTVNPAPAASGNQTYTCTVSDGNGGSASSNATVYVSADLYGHSLPNTGAFDFENVAVGDIAEFEFTAPATASDVLVACSAFSNPPGIGVPTTISVDVVPVAAGSWSGGGCGAASSLQLFVIDGVPNVDVFTFTPGQRYVVYLSNPGGPDAMDIHCDVSAWYEFTNPAGLAAQALTNVNRGVNPGGACP